MHQEARYSAREPRWIRFTAPGRGVGADDTADDEAHEPPSDTDVSAWSLNPLAWT